MKKTRTNHSPAFKAKVALDEVDPIFRTKIGPC